MVMGMYPAALAQLRVTCPPQHVMLLSMLLWPCASALEQM